MSVSESDVINGINAYTYISCQTSAEANSSTNTTASLLYNSQSRNQGNFSTFYTLAQEEIASDLARLDITLTDANKIRAYAYLICSYFDMKDKHWNATTIKSGDDQVTYQTNVASARKAYDDILQEASSAETTGLTSTDTDLVQHTDYINYPDEFKDSQITDVDIDLET